MSQIDSIPETDRAIHREALLPNRLIIVAREGWGNTDFIEFARGAMALGVDVHFVGYPAVRSIDVTPVIHAPRVDLGSMAFTREAARICKAILNENSSNVTAIHVRYYKTCVLLPTLIGTPAALDIRSGSIRSSATIRAIENKLMQLEALAYKRVTVVSCGVATVLGLRQFSELPLGASADLLKIARNGVPNVGKLRFIYIGTLKQRTMHIFASAFADYVARRGLDWRLDLYGYGSDEDVARIDAVARRFVSVRFHGHLPRKEISQQLAHADIGVSFVPITPYFDWQPPTKTFEYLMAGLPTLATRTAANTEVVTDGRGWLCEDTVDSIQDALQRVEQEKGGWIVKRDFIRDRTWEMIFAKYYRSEILSRSFWMKQ